MLPPFVYSKAFWQSLSVIVALVAVQAGWTDVDLAVKLELAFLAVLQVFDIVPELRAKGLME